MTAPEDISFFHSLTVTNFWESDIDKGSSSFDGAILSKMTRLVVSSMEQSSGINDVIDATKGAVWGKTEVKVERRPDGVIQSSSAGASAGIGEEGEPLSFSTGVTGKAEGFRAEGFQRDVRDAIMILPKT